jgi:hypothetical protein
MFLKSPWIWLFLTCTNSVHNLCGGIVHSWYLATNSNTVCIPGILTISIIVVYPIIKSDVHGWLKIKLLLLLLKVWHIWLFCIDVDECSRHLDNCARKSQCINTIGTFSCKCNHGYTGNGVTCTGRWCNLVITDNSKLQSLRALFLTSYVSL